MATQKQIPEIYKRNPQLLVDDRNKLNLFFYNEGTPPDQKTITKFVDHLRTDIGFSQKDSIKQIGITLEQWYETLNNNVQETITEVPQYSQSLRSDELQNLQEAAQKVEDQKAEIKEKVRDFTNQEIEARQKIAEQRRSIQEQINKAQQIRDSLKDEKVYTKVTIKDDQIDLTQNEKRVIEDFKNFANTSPQQAAQELKETLLNTNVFKGVDVKDAEVLATAAAVDAVTTATEKIEYSPAIQIATYTQVANKFPNRPEVKELTEKVVITQREMYEQSRKIVSLALGKKFADNVIPSIERYSVEISDTSQSGFTQNFNYTQIPDYYTQTLSNQGVLLDNIKDFGQDAVKGEIRSHLGGLIEKRLASLPSGHFLKSEAVTNILGTFGVGNSITWAAAEGANPMVSFAVKMGYGPTLGVVQSATGLNLGVKKVAGEVGKKITEKVATGVGTKVAGQVVGKAAGTGLAATLAAAGTYIAPIIGTAIGLALGWLAEKVLPWLKKTISKNKELLFGLGAIGMFINPFIGTPLLLLGGAGIIAGGTALTLGGLASGFFGFFGMIGRTIVFEIATPVLVTILVFPIIVTLILFIINSGAYVVPPSISNLLKNQDNLYIEVTKTADPAGPFENSDLPLKVTYKIEVIARRDPLINIRFKHECKVIQEGKSGVCDAPTEKAPETITPGSSYVYTYTTDYKKGNEDALISNTFTVTADTPEKTNETTSGNATITIGEPPAKCLKIDGNWPSGAEAHMEYAKQILIEQYSNYVVKVCAEYPDPKGLPLRYNYSGHGSYWGWNHNEYIDFYQLGTKSDEDALYTLAHELGHSMAWRVKGIDSSYGSFPGITSEAPYCFYKDTASFNRGESMPEAIALYVLNGKKGCPIVKTKYPKHYEFLIKKVFN